MALRAVSNDLQLEPHDIDAEQAVLGACLIDRDVVVRLAPWLQPEDFYVASHMAIWRAMVALYHERIPIDLVTLTNRIRRNRDIEHADGETYLTDLVTATPTAVHADYYAGIVRQAAVRRRLAHAAARMTQAAWDESLPLTDVLAQAEDAVTAVSRTGVRETFREMGELMDGAFERMDQDASPIIPTGISEIDRVLGGVQPGQSVVIAARPGVGKSSLALQMADGMAKAGVPVGFIALEMAAAELAGRLIAMYSGVSLHRQVTAAGSLTAEERQRMTHAFGVIGDRPLYIDDRSDFSLQDVVGRCNTLIAERSVKVLFIDYIQLMHSRSSGRGEQNRAYELATITKALKRLALHSGVTVVGMAQLNRGLEHRSDPRPMLSDLRDSGSLEQDADVVLFLHRPDHYRDDAEPNVTELIVAKHRNGPTGTARLLFVNHKTSFASVGATVGRY